MEQTYPRIRVNTAIYWRTIFVIFLGSMAAFGAEYCVQPLIPVIAADFYLSPASASLAVSAGLFGMALSMLFIAVIGPALDRKKITTVSLLVAAVFTIVIGLCSNFYLILLLRFFQGVILAAFPSLMIAYINEEFEASSVGSVLGIYIGANAIGGLAGRLIVSSMADFFSWRTGLIMIGLLYLAIALSVGFFLPKSHHKNTGTISFKPGKIIANIFSDTKLLLIYLIGFCAMGSFVSVYNFITYVLLHEPYNLSQTFIGCLFFTYLIGSFSSAYMGKKTYLWGNGRVIGISALLMLLGIIITILMPLLCKILGLVIFTFGFFGCHTGACGWVGKLNKGDKAVSSSLYMFLYYTGASALGTLGGFFLEHYGWNGVVVMVIAAEVICFLLLHTVNGMLKKEK